MPSLSVIVRECWAGTRGPGRMTPVRLSGSAADSCTTTPSSGRRGDGPQLLGGLGQGELLAGEAGDITRPEHHAPRLEPPQRPEDVAPGDRERLAQSQVPEDDAPAGEQLAGDRLGELVGSRPASAASRPARPP